MQSYFRKNFFCIILCPRLNLPRHAYGLVCKNLKENLPSLKFAHWQLEMKGAKKKKKNENKQGRILFCLQYLYILTLTGSLDVFSAHCVQREPMGTIPAD